MLSYLPIWDALNKVDGLFRNPNVLLWKRKLWHEKSSLSTSSAPLVESFIITHNPDHKRMKRPPSTTATPSVALVSRPYNPDAFNFTKASIREVVCLVKLRAGETPSFTWLSSLDNSGGTSADLTALPSNDSDVHPVFVNVSPIFRGHGLFVPHVLQGNAQVANTSLLTLGVRLASLFSSESKDFKCGFNSLSAFASVNHFHLHTIFASALQPDGTSSNSLPCENAPLGKLLWQQTIAGVDNDEAILSCNVHDWIVPGFVFSLHLTHKILDNHNETQQACMDNNYLSETQILAISKAAGRLVERLVASEIPHHFLITDGGRKVYVWPRKAQVPSFNDRSQMALLECAGVLILNEGSAYDETSVDKVTVSEVYTEMTDNVAQTRDILDKIAQEEIEIVMKDKLK